MKSAHFSGGNVSAPLNELYLHSAMLISQLITEDGRIFASQDERFHHYFGRDTMFTAIFIAHTFQNMPNKQNGRLFDKAKKAVLNFWNFQTPEGKIPHEIKPVIGNEDEPLYKSGYYYKEGEFFVNNESVDATPLTLIATAIYLKDNKKEIERLKPKIIKALLWMIATMDAHYGWLSYFPNHRGVCQGWMDSIWGAADRNGTNSNGPIALVEVQAFVWQALRAWDDLLDHETVETLQLRSVANNLRERFHKEFLIEITLSSGERKKYFAHAIAEEGKVIDNVSINPGFCLWARYKEELFIKKDYVNDIVDVLLSGQFFHEKGGIRTFAADEPTFDPEYYHSGKHVFWPFATALVAQGIIASGEQYHEKGRMVMMANFHGILYFRSFIEHFIISDTDGSYLLNPEGFSVNCSNQTWTVAAFWWMIHHPVLFEEVKQEIPGFDNYLKLVSETIEN